MIEPGRYNAKAVDGGWNTMASGDPELVVEFVTLESNERVYAHVYFSDKAFDRSIESLRAMGWQGDNLAELYAPDAIVRLCGGDVSLVIEHEEYEGKTQVKVRWINALGGVRIKSPIEQNALASFGARMQGRIRAIDAAKPKAAAPAAKNAAPAAKPASTDDIPF